MMCLTAAFEDMKDCVADTGKVTSGYSTLCMSVLLELAKACPAYQMQNIMPSHAPWTPHNPHKNRVDSLESSTMFLKIIPVKSLLRLSQDVTSRCDDQMACCKTSGPLACQAGGNKALATISERGRIMVRLACLGHCARWPQITGRKPLSPLPDKPPHACRQTCPAGQEGREGAHGGIKIRRPVQA